MARVVHYFHDHAASMQQAAADQEALMEDRHEAQMAALRATHSPTLGGQSVSFIPNKGFN
jgi:hypothetical protein